MKRGNVLVKGRLFKLGYRARLVLLALLLAGLWFGGEFRPLGRDEALAWTRVRAAQRMLWETQERLGAAQSRADDPLETGLIGVEWSDITTTLGDLRAKRTSTNPIWTSRMFEWFDRLGLRAGDRIVIYSSSSFPALLLAALVAAEARGLEILLAVSLGSSTWGANRAEFPWPAMHRALLESGFVRTRAAFCTPGGRGERGADMPPEALRDLERLARELGTPFVVPRDTEEAIRIKTEAMDDFSPKLLISIGGPAANLGPSESLHPFPSGLVLPGAQRAEWGDGVARRALERGVPVLNLLNVRALAAEAGIPWDDTRFIKTRLRPSAAVAAAGLALFFIVMALHRRWEWDG